MAAKLREVYENLKRCTQQLEDDYSKTVEALPDMPMDETSVLIDKTRDYHYQEILNHLRQIKDHLEKVAHHDRQIQGLQDKAQNNNSLRIDKNYIKRQVEAFQSKYSSNTIPRRAKKPSASSRASHQLSDSTSMKYLATWESLLDKQDMLKNEPEEAEAQKTEEVEKAKVVVENFRNHHQRMAEVKKRSNNALRKHKKFVSSTMEDMLDRREFLSNRGISRSLDFLGRCDEEAEEDGGCGATGAISTSLIFQKREVPEGASAEEDNNNNDDDKNGEGVTKPKIIGIIFKEKT